jgi:hypothetical protein
MTLNLKCKRQGCKSRPFSYSSFILYERVLDWVNDKPTLIENEPLPFGILRITVAQNGDQPSCLNLSRTCQRKAFVAGFVETQTSEKRVWPFSARPTAYSKRM